MPHYRFIVLTLCVLCLSAQGDLFDWGRSSVPIFEERDQWGNAGVFTQPVGAGDDGVRATVYQSDGKLLVAGFSHNGAHNDMVVMRVHPDGSLDRTFGTNGTSLLGFPGGESIAHAVGLDTQGRVLVAGRAWGMTDYDFGVARLSTDGLLDSSFNGGLFTVNLGSADFARAVSADYAGRVVVGGYTNQPGRWGMAAIRLLSDGTLDPAFSGDGMQITSVHTVADIGYALVIQSDNKVVLTGMSQIGATPRFAVVRYLTNGNLDNTFSGDGMDAWALGLSDDTAWGATIGTNGHIYLAGRSQVGSAYRMAIASYLPDGTHNDSNTFGVGASSVARAISLDGPKKYLGGRVWDGADWNMAMLRLDSANGSISLDASFSGTGYAITSFGSVDEVAYGIVVQPDNKVVAVGSRYGSNGDFSIARFNENGSLDNSFDTDGRITVPVGTGMDVAYGAALQSDGKILAGGLSYNGTRNHFALTRHLTNGALDTSFSGDGIVITSVGSGNAVINAVAVATNSRIYAAGTTYSGANGNFAIARYHSNGNLDTNFGTVGIATADFNAADDAIHGMVIDTAGRLVVAGYAVNGTSREMAVARFHTTGVLDTHFSGDGKQTVSFITSSDDIAFGVALQDDGRIVLAGHTHNNTQTQFAIARLLTNGTLDNSFDTDGRVTTSIDTTHGIQALAVALQTNGNIVVGGHSLQIQNRAILTRYLSNGAIDTSFFSAGFLTQAFTSGDNIIYDVAVDSSNRIVAAGHAMNGNLDYLALRVAEATGSQIGLDNTFGSGGVSLTPLSADDDIGIAMANSAGKLSLVGRSFNGTNFDFAFARYNADGTLAGSGSLDAGFGTGGVVTTAVSANNDLAHGVVVQSDHRILVAGTTDNGTSDDFLILRYTSAGVLDATFSGDGIQTTSFGAGDDKANDIAMDYAGRIVAVGSSEVGAGNRFAIARYLSNGTLDNAFDSDGMVLTSFSTGNNDVAVAVAIQTDNKIVVGGLRESSAVNGFGLARYNTNGSLDNSFDGDGLVTTEIDTASGSELHDVIVQPDGRIVAVGRTLRPISQIAVARYLSNGALDTTFNSTGILAASLTAGSDVAFGVAYDQGRLVITGHAVGTSSTYDLALARITSNGAFDVSFGTGGFTRIAVGSNDEFGYACVLQPNGKTVAAGFSFGSNYDFATIRVNSNGGLDTHFGTAGAVTANINGNDLGQAVALSPDGRIVVVGHSKNGGTYDISVVRYWP